MLYIIIAVLVFGILVATHELGHFLSAKLLGVKVNEFAVGMGPALLKWGKGETLYSLRALPIGGFCAMEGEDDDSADPRSFGRASWWRKIIILCAGAAMNFLTGLAVLLVLNSQSPGFAMPAVAGFMEGYGLEECGLLPGDLVVSVDGRRMYSMFGYNRLTSALSRSGDSADWVVERNGERISLKDVSMPRQARVDEEGRPTNYRGLNVGLGWQEATTGRRLLYSWYDAVDLVHVAWESLGSLIRGQVGLRELSGPVGIVDMMGQVGSDPQLSPTPLAAARNLAHLAALIAVNLAVMNLLPLPALDGGRVFFLALNGVLYSLFRKKIDAKYEGYVHLAGLAALMCLMLAVTLSDVGKLFGR